MPPHEAASGVPVARCALPAAALYCERALALDAHCSTCVSSRRNGLKSVPTIVTTVPPAVGPPDGERESRDGSRK